MSTITKEWLQQKIAEMEAARDEIPLGLDEDDSNTLAALRIALASLEAEAVAWTDADELRDVKNGGNGYLFAIGGEANKFADPRRQVILYTAPPAPVSVPDAYVRDGRGRMMLNGRQEPRIGYSAGWNACRAAMLQGADGNSPVIPDGWVLVPMEPTEEMCDVGHVGVDVLTGVTDGNEYYSIDGKDAAKVYRAMIAAAPQQEVKP
ncbi:hypothetical protein [Enterobacter pseudoroggenkampii]|uniref:hypothetical protein n=1 Tax=Enterobacter pseudoroggenkampii TaxID=2996112 RepID=UPI0038A02B38